MAFMNVGELRQSIKDLPDSAEVILAITTKETNKHYSATTRYWFPHSARAYRDQDQIIIHAEET